MDENSRVQLEITASAFTEVRQALEGLTSQLGKTTAQLTKLENSSLKLGKNASKGMREASNEMNNFGRIHLCLNYLMILFYDFQ